MKKQFMGHTMAITSLLLVALSLQSCIDKRQVVLRGTLYADSTLATPVPNDTISFWWYDGSPIGRCTTDSAGRFGFSFWPDGADNWDNTYQSKFQVEYPRFWAICKSDTLGWLEAYPGGYANLEFYLGKHFDYYWK